MNRQSKNSKTKKDKKDKAAISKRAIPKSDGLFKDIMATDVAIQEFLDFYLPSPLKDKLDISKAELDKESYVEEDLTQRFSDLIYSIPYKNDSLPTKQKAFVICLLEHQSTSDKWIALRLWKYILLLCERYKDKNEKLPIIIPYIVYNGPTKYTAPKSFWQLFDSPELAKEMMGDEYTLIDLQSMSNEEIKQKAHMGMLEFFLKHIHERDLIRVWEEFFKYFKEIIALDKDIHYLYIKRFIWYTESKVDEKNKGELYNVITRHLSKNEGDKIMTTIAESYIQQGIEQGIEQGIQQGIEQGIEQTAIKMLESSISPDLISSITGISEENILKLDLKLKNKKH